MATAANAPEAIPGVLELTRRIKESLETDFGALWVRGELSGCKRAESGHVYFTLKEGRDAVLDCVLFRTEARRLPFEPRDGVQVEAFGGLTVYEPRGRYQMIVREMRPAGLGALLLALEELKRRLQAEGLFDAARKRPLPRYPSRIGLVTSPVGAAVRDLVKVLRSRWPGIRIVLAPVRVQGPDAAAEIAGAIARFNAHRGVDVLVVGRGGGSLEDLWAFNEEPVVRAIAASAIPVVSAVGHEVDVTLADHVADVRAATPSNAAEIVVPERREVLRHVAVLREHARRAIAECVAHRRRRLEALTAKYGFRRQRDALGPLRQRIDDCIDRARRALGGRMGEARLRLGHARDRYGLREWPRSLAARRERVAALRLRLDDAARAIVLDGRRRALGCGDQLRALSPERVLDRGFCIAKRADGTVVRAAAVLAAGELLSLDFASGGADARVEQVRERRGESAG